MPSDANLGNRELEAYAQSLQSELDKANADKAALIQELSSGDGENNIQAIQDALLPEVPQLVVNIIQLANAADSESVRLAASRLGLEIAVGGKLGGKIGGSDADEDFKKLIQKIKKDPEVMKQKAEAILQTRKDFKNSPKENNNGGSE